MLWKKDLRLGKIERNSQVSSTWTEERKWPSGRRNQELESQPSLAGGRTWKNIPTFTWARTGYLNPEKVTKATQIVKLFPEL